MRIYSEAEVIALINEGQKNIIECKHEEGRTPVIKPRRRRVKAARKKRRVLWVRQWGLCCWCNKFVEWEYSTLEHLIPLSMGGTNDPGNLKMACRKCNNTRHNLQLVITAPFLGHIAINKEAGLDSPTEVRYNARDGSETTKETSERR